MCSAKHKFGAKIRSKLMRSLVVLPWILGGSSFAAPGENPAKPVTAGEPTSQPWIIGPIFKGEKANNGNSSPAPASAVSTSDRPKVWVSGVRAQRFALKGGDGNELMGNSTSVSIGHGHVASQWFAYGTLDIMFGPYDQVRGGQFEADTYGTGLAAWWGYNAQLTDLRHEDGGYGFAMGLDYKDITARSVGPNRKQDPSRGEDQRRLASYFLRCTNFNVVPALFFSWMQPARPAGSTPELLKTRVEGYMLFLGLAMPIDSNYRAKLEYDGKNQEGENEAGSNRKGSPPAKTSEKGQFQGYSVLISFLALFGT